MAVTLAIRAMKARRTKGRCPLCRGLLVTGTYIALLPGLGWAHSSCAMQQHQTELRSHA